MSPRTSAKLSLLLSLFALFSPGISHAESYTSTAVCQIGNNPAVSLPSYCEVGTYGTGPFAQTMGELAIVSSPYHGFFVQEYLQTIGFLSANPAESYIPAFSAISLNYSTELTTSGPVRPGFVVLDSTSSIELGQGITGNLTFGLQSLPAPVPLTITCQFTSQACQGAPNFSAFGKIPITLGVPFGFAANSAGSVFADETTFSSLNRIYVDYRYQFFEADGVTPVAATFIPEPSTPRLLLIAALLLVFVVGRRRTHPDFAHRQNSQRLQPRPL